MTDHPKILFLRHGQTVWNAERRIQGRKNSDLTEQGIAQAHKQARILAPAIPGILAGGGRLYCSPQGRARQTADIALGGREYTVDARLSEISTGEWEGRLRSEVASDVAGLDVYVNAPGGEGFEVLQHRVSAFLEELTTSAVIVSHGILGQILRGLVCGLSRAEMSALSNAQGCVYVLENGLETVLQDAPADLV